MAEAQPAPAPVAPAPIQPVILAAGPKDEYKRIRLEAAKKEIKKYFDLFDTQENGTVDALYDLVSVF